MYTETQTNKNWITPWGRSHGAIKIESNNRVIYRLDTPSHGGYAVPKSTAIKRIPPGLLPTLKNAFFYFFEEDCAWAIACFYLPEFFPQNAREDAINTMRHYYPQFLG